MCIHLPGAILTNREPNFFKPQTASKMAYLQLEQIEKHYDEFHALKGINLEVEKEEFVVFVGP